MSKRILYSERAQDSATCHEWEALSKSRREKGRKGKRKGRKQKQRDLNRCSLPALARPRADTDLEEISSCRQPALGTQSPRPPALPPSQGPRALAAGGRNRCRGGDTEVARAHLAVALPPDLLAAAVGARADGVQHLVVLRPSGHGRALRRPPAGRSAGSEG